MTHAELLTLAILAATVVLFLSDRVRFDVVGLLALTAAVILGIVPAKDAFSGFANPVLPLIAAALILSAAIGQSGAVEVLLRWLQPLLRSRQLQVGVLVACVALLSVFIKNVGALAIFLPAAVQVARRNERSPAEFLMPLAFASLLGGSCTLIGTSPNLLISAVRQELIGAPFKMFDFTPVGAGIAVLGVIFLTFGWRLIPLRRNNRATEPALAVENYTSELRVGARSAYIGRTVGEVEELSGGAIGVTAVIRGETRRHVPGARWPVYAGDILVVEAEPVAIEQFARDGNLELVGGEEEPSSAAPATAVETPPEAEESVSAAHLEAVEAVVTPDSPLIGRSAAELHLRELYGVNVLAISRRGQRTRTRLRRMRLQLGDVIVFQGYPESIYDTLAALGCLPLAERQLRLGRPRRLAVPLLILGLAMAASGFELAPAAVAFVAAALAIVLLRLLPLREAYAAIDWPVIIMIGAMIPVGEAVSTSGTADLVAAGLSHLAPVLPAYGILAVILIASMLVTPVLHHAPAVLVMGPIAASLAHKLGYHVDPFLMAVAVGAGSDFLSPVGHQSNTLVMAPGGYRFADYWHLGLPLSFLVILLGVPLIVIFWPLH
ncbi:MAG TPA: SLC13 family permease [Stellaceae bacterium]|nr:SLC13 family permease [Stellaceae bacterium]